MWLTENLYEYNLLKKKKIPTDWTLYKNSSANKGVFFVKYQLVKIENYFYIELYLIRFFLLLEGNPIFYYNFDLGKIIWTFKRMMSTSLKFKLF